MILIFGRSPQLLSHLWRHLSLGPLTHKTVSLSLPQTWSVVADYIDGVPDCQRCSHMPVFMATPWMAKAAIYALRSTNWETQCLDKLSPAQRNKSKIGSWDSTQVLWLQISALSTEKDNNKALLLVTSGDEETDTIFPFLWVKQIGTSLMWKAESASELQSF